MDDGDGVYYSADQYPQDRPGPRRLKKAAVAVVGLAAVLGGASFAVTSLLNRPSNLTSTREPAALAPAISRSPAPRPTPRRTLRSPAPGPIPGTLGAARQSSRPSPTPSLSPPALMTDSEVASDQVSRLLQAQPVAPSGPSAGSSASSLSGSSAGSLSGSSSSMTAARDPVTVVNESGADGSTIRVVSARYDVTARWGLLRAADSGEKVENARCTQRFRGTDSATPQTRPGLLLCWRTAKGKSVVAIAVAPTGTTPTKAASLAALDRAWAAL